MTLNTTRIPDTDWTDQMDGRWWLVHEGGEDADENMRAFMRIKMSTGRWATRCGWKRNLRRRNHGQMVWVRFLKPGTATQ